MTICILSFLLAVVCPAAAAGQGNDPGDPGDSVEYPGSGSAQKLSSTPAPPHVMEATVAQPSRLSRNLRIAAPVALALLLTLALAAARWRRLATAGRAPTRRATSREARHSRAIRPPS
ncbi:MAG: hypothetical protein OXH98_08770 [Caldilineaceae bacterium]|nr:hypothetical protein [Caldilineaceae bacterium]